MDPNQLLGRLRVLAEDNADGDGMDDLSEMAQAFIALDDWLRRGGFLPERWAEGRSA